MGFRTKVIKFIQINFSSPRQDFKSVAKESKTIHFDFAISVHVTFSKLISLANKILGEFSNCIFALIFLDFHGSSFDTDASGAGN